MIKKSTLLLFWKYARYGVLLLLIGLMAISSHPYIVDLSDESGITNGTILSKYINLVFSVLFIMCLTNVSFFKSKTFKFCGIAVFVILLYYLITYAFFGTKNMLGDARAILISLFAMVIGWQLNFEKRELLYIVLLVYAGLVLYVGLMQVIVNIGGFEILDLYESDHKNALGVMLSTSVIIFLFVGLNWQEIGWARFVFFVAALVTIVVILTIRARASTVGCVLVLLYVFFARYKKRNFVIYLIVGIVLIVILYNVIPDAVKDYVYNSFYQNYENDDVTSDRLNRNRAALRFLSQHFWLGNLNVYTNLDWIHNYPLEKMYKYGFIFSFPILVMYLFLLVVAFVKSVKADNRNIYCIGCYLLLVPYIVSMAEPTLPFGPGTATIFNFIFFGIFLRKIYDEIPQTKK